MTLIDMLTCFYAGKHTTNNGTCAQCEWTIVNGTATQAPTVNDAVAAERFAKWLGIES